MFGADARNEITDTRGAERRNSPVGRCPKSYTTSMAAMSSSKAGFACAKKGIVASGKRSYIGHTKRAVIPNSNTRGARE